MQSTSFQFKQFSVAHNKCAMKVNTDGVLLGAWQDINNAENILDIGTGSGVIALMMAQKNSQAHIDAIDIDEGAFEQAKENFGNSPWSNRLTAVLSSVQNFSPLKKYDLIISNPPYFIADFKTADHKKNIARHSIALDYETLVINIDRLLLARGKALVGIPAFNFAKFEALVGTRKLFVTETAEVAASDDKPPYLTLIQLERETKSLLKTSIQIQQSGGVFTRQYKAITRDFYLKF